MFVFKDNLSSLTAENKSISLYYYHYFLFKTYPSMPYILSVKPSQAISNSNLYLQILYL